MRIVRTENRNRIEIGIQGILGCWKFLWIGKRIKKLNCSVIKVFG